MAATTSSCSDTDKGSKYLAADTSSSPNKALMGALEKSPDPNWG